MKQLIRLYSVVLIAATVFSVADSANSADSIEYGRPLVKGVVLATD